MAVQRSFNLNINPRQHHIVNVPLVQYDDGGVEVVFNMYDGSTAYSIPSGSAVWIRGTKPDGYGFIVECTFSGSTVTVPVNEQMTAVEGRVYCTLSIENGGNILGTAPFVLNVTRNGVSDDTIVSDSDLGDLIEAVQAAGDVVYAYEDQNEAESKYHSVLASAAISKLPVHTAFLLTDDGFKIESKCYRHEEKTEE